MIKFAHKVSLSSPEFVKQILGRSSVLEWIPLEFSLENSGNDNGERG